MRPQVELCPSFRKRWEGDWVTVFRMGDIAVTPNDADYADSGKDNAPEIQWQAIGVNFIIGLSMKCCPQGNGKHHSCQRQRDDKTSGGQKSLWLSGERGVECDPHALSPFIVTGYRLGPVFSRRANAPVSIRSKKTPSNLNCIVAERMLFILAFAKSARYRYSWFCQILVCFKIVPYYWP